jgi:hypothetical protein
MTDSVLYVLYVSYVTDGQTFPILQSKEDVKELSLFVDNCFKTSDGLRYRRKYDDNDYDNKLFKRLIQTIRFNKFVNIYLDNN